MLCCSKLVTSLELTRKSIMKKPAIAAVSSLFRGDLIDIQRANTAQSA